MRKGDEEGEDKEMEVGRRKEVVEGVGDSGGRSGKYGREIEGRGRYGREVEEGMGGRKEAEEGMGGR